MAQAVRKPPPDVLTDEEMRRLEQGSQLPETLTDEEINHLAQGGNAPAPSPDVLTDEQMKALETQAPPQQPSTLENVLKTAAKGPIGALEDVPAVKDVLNKSLDAAAAAQPLPEDKRSLVDKAQEVAIKGLLDTTNPLWAGLPDDARKAVWDKAREWAVTKPNAFAEALRKNGLEKLGVPTEADITKEAGTTGKVPYLKIAANVAGDAAAGMVPLSPEEIANIAGAGMVTGEVAKLPIFQKSLGEIGGALKDWAMTKEVKVPISPQEVKDFYTFGREKLSPEAYDVLINMDPEALKAIVKARGGVEGTKRVPRFQTTIDRATLGDQAAEYVASNLPDLAQEIDGKTFPVEKDIVHEVLKKAGAAAEEVNLRGGTPEQGQLAAKQTFQSEIKKAMPPTLEPDQVGEVTKPEPAEAQPSSVPPQSRPEGEPSLPQTQQDPDSRPLSETGSVQVPPDVFPSLRGPSKESIAQHPDYVKAHNDAVSVVNAYAKQRGVEPSFEFAKQLHAELHDAPRSFVYEKDPAKRAEIQKAFEAKYPDYQNEWLTMNNKIAMSNGGHAGVIQPNGELEQKYFENNIQGMPDSLRPKAAISPTVAVKPSDTKPSSEKFYIAITDGEGKPKFIEVKGKAVDVGHGIEAFVHKGDQPKEWRVTEARSGQKMGEGTSQKRAIEDAKAKIEILEKRGAGSTKKLIKKVIKEKGLSPRYAKPTPSGKNADVGSFNENLPRWAGQIERTNPIEMPELVQLATELMGQPPGVRAKMGQKLGYFQGGGPGKIVLRADLFKEPLQAAKTLAHEIGHLTDYLPDQTLKRGNLLGRLLTLQGFRKNIFEGVMETDKALRAEMWAMSKEWRPLMKAQQPAEGAPAEAPKATSMAADVGSQDEGNVSEGYLKYRKSAKEIYADAISALLNSPGYVEKKAPLFYKAFFEHLDKKPEVKVAYFAIQDMLNGDREQVIKNRSQRILDGFAKGEAIQEDYKAKRQLARQSFWERLRQEYDDINYPLMKKVYEAEASGATIPEADNPKFVLQEGSFVDNENFLMVMDVGEKIVKPLEDAGISLESAGEYLLLNRVLHDRADIANPYGFNRDNAQEQLTFLETNLGQEKAALLKTKINELHDLVFPALEEGVRVGSISKDVFDTKVVPNKYTYAPFAVIDYLQDRMPATIKAQVGTLKEVANPFHALVLKTVALNRLNAYQRSKNSAIQFLSDNFPAEIGKTKTVGHQMRVFRPKQGMGSIEVLEDGKLVSYDVDPHIAESFKRSKVGDLNTVVHLLDMFNNKLFKPLVTTYNLGFALAFNPIRDFKANYKLINDATVGGLLKAYVKSFPSAVKYSKGELDAFTRSMIESKAILAPINDYNFDPKEDDFAKILYRYGIIHGTDSLKSPGVVTQVRRALLKPVVQVLEGVRFMGNTLEIVSKIAGAKMRMAQGESGKVLAHNLRNYTGTPNWKVKGEKTTTTNAIFTFSNIMKEGLKRDFEVATNPKTRSGYWWKTTKVDLMPKFLMFLAGAGILGKELKDFYDNASEYDKTNYILIPLGYSNHKAIYMRIPHDETGRMVSAVAWKMMNFAKDHHVQDLQQAFAFGAGQLPQVTPAASLLAGWIQYLSGRNPYDDFRGRNVVDSRSWKQGGGAALKKMVQWSFNQVGLASFATYDASKDTTMETVTRVTPLINRLFRITSYGKEEQKKNAEAMRKTGGLFGKKASGGLR